MSSLQVYKNLEGSLGNYSYQAFNNDIRLNVSKCTNKCGNCLWDEVIFEHEPFWIDLFNN